MWLRLLIYYIFIVILPVARCHIPSYVVTPSNRVDQHCGMSETCVHDTIPICGKNGDETRAFLDICDLLEYACDTGEVFQHVDDLPGCPVIPQG